jgi:hypothetical protein
MQYLIFSLLLALFAPMASAALPGVEFSATAVQQAPNQPVREARMVVTPDKVRMEYKDKDQTLIEITDLAAGRSLRVMPDSGTYEVQQARPQVLEQIRQAQGPKSPCVGNPQASCKQLGEETLFGRPVVKWEMAVEYQGRTYRSLYWLDKERFMPLRQMWADGTVNELRPVGKEMLGSRATEKWEMVTKRSNGQTTTATQWFDVELGLVIREELPGGYLRELRDIRVGPQDPALFEVPAGYRQVAPQAPAATGR